MDDIQETKEEFLELISLKTNDMPQGFIYENIPFDLSFHKHVDASIKSKRNSEPQSPFEVDLQPITPHDNSTISEINLTKNSVDTNKIFVAVPINHTNDFSCIRDNRNSQLLSSRSNKKLGLGGQNFPDNFGRNEFKFNYQEALQKPLGSDESFLSEGPSIHFDIKIKTELLYPSHPEFKVNIIQCDEKELPYGKTQDIEYPKLIHNETILRSNPLFKTTPVISKDKLKLRKPKKTTLKYSNKILEPLLKIPLVNTLEPPKLKITARSQSSNKCKLEVPKIKISVRSTTSSKLSNISTQDNHSSNISRSSKKQLITNPYLQKHSKKVLKSLIGNTKLEHVKSSIGKAKKKRIVF